MILSATKLAAAWRRLGWDLPLYALGAGVDQFGRLAVVTLTASALAPEAFGRWVIMALVLQYLPFISLGVSSGLARQVPISLGSGGEVGAQRLEDVALGATIVSGLVASGLGSGLLIVLLGASPIEIVVFGAVAFLQQLAQLEQSLARARIRFRAAAAQLTGQGVASLIVGSSLVGIGAGVLAPLAGRVAAFAVALLLAPRTLVRIPRPTFRLSRAVGLVRVGFPLMVGGLLVTVLLTLDRWLVELWLGRAALGVYGLVGYGLSALLFFPLVLSQQYYPRLAFLRGMGRPLRELMSVATEQSVVAAALTALTGAGLVSLAGFGIPALMPAYRDAVTPLILVCVGAVVYAAGAPFGNLISISGHHDLYLGLQVAAVVAEFLAMTALLFATRDLVGAAGGTAAALATYSLTLLLAARWLSSSGDDDGRWSRGRPASRSRPTAAPR